MLNQNRLAERGKTIFLENIWNKKMFFFKLFWYLHNLVPKFSSFQPVTTDVACLEIWSSEADMSSEVKNLESCKALRFFLQNSVMHYSYVQQMNKLIWFDL